VTFSVGTLVRARGREWVVLPDSTEDLLVVRPLGGSDDEITGLYTPMEAVETASFALPDAKRDLGDYRSARLLHEALRLSIRASAGPFRSFGRIAVEPRPYQLVPLLMALRLDPVRLLIADDVGVGKTVESLLIARELLDRGEIRRFSVLCPPHLAEQWQLELKTKFHIDAELVVAATAARVERSLKLGAGDSLFDKLDATVVSMDFIKSDRRRDEFIRTAPEFVIVDEAHTCTDASSSKGSRHQRFRLLRDLSAKPGRHLVLVTATPHSGKDEAFGELLGFLDPSFKRFATSMDDSDRAELAKHFVQRRRGDIRAYLDIDTPFPKRDEPIDAKYNLSPASRRLLEHVLAYARETVSIEGEGSQRQRIRWWAALALLRSVSSSPRAAVATLRNRAQVAEAVDAAEIEELGRRTVLDLIDDESAEGSDVVPGAEADPEAAGGTSASSTKRRLRELANEAEALIGSDPKLTRGLALIREMLKQGRNPIVFCRYIATAEYVADELRDDLARTANKREFGEVAVDAVTGNLPADERKARVEELSNRDRRVLVATDCLSEGINLQRGFDAVVHYDLAWNPTRHEQREGRVDRYGQPQPTVAAATLYGQDNPIDGLVLDVLLRRHERIRSLLGFSVPVPVDSNAVLEAILEGILLKRPKNQQAEDQLVFFEELVKPKKDELHREWDRAAEAEKQSRSRFAQRTVAVEEVAKELREVRDSVGSSVDIARFTAETLERHGATVKRNGLLDVDLQGVHLSFIQATNLEAALGSNRRFKARFEEPVDEKTLLLSRTHPVVEGLASWVIDTALDPIDDSEARRCGAIRTDKVQVRTTALLLRIRYDLTSAVAGGQTLAEEARIVAFRGPVDRPDWLTEDAAVELLGISPSGNLSPEISERNVAQVLESWATMQASVNAIARDRADAIRDAHDRVRTAGKMRGRTKVEPRLPVDLLGVYVFLPQVIA
jgi:superfamily II DNA or RNA helicase